MAPWQRFRSFCLVATAVKGNVENTESAENVENVENVDTAESAESVDIEDMMVTTVERAMTE